MTRIWTILRSVWGSQASIEWFSDSGRFCRVCGRGIDHGDPFGVSEGVCPACRSAA
jgi:hypothetical protein